MRRCLAKLQILALSSSCLGFPAQRVIKVRPHTGVISSNVGLFLGLEGLK
jgi:hypothetical protein